MSLRFFGGLLAALAFVGLGSCPATAQTWSAPTDLTAVATNSPTVRGYIGSDPAGTVTAVWGNSSSILATTYASGAWGAPVSVGAYGGEFPSARIAVAADGSRTIVWRDNTGSGIAIIRASRNTGSGWSAPVAISDTNLLASSPEVAVDAAGVVTAAWLASNNGVVKAARFVSGAWTAPVDIADGQPSTAPSIAAEPSGSVTVAWGTNSGIRATRFTGSWSAPVLIASATIFQSDVRLAANASGVVQAVWKDFTTGAQVIRASRFSAGSWGPADALSVPAASVGLPALALASDGTATALWFRGNGSNNIVQTAHFEGSAWSAPLDLSPAGENGLPDDLAVDREGGVTALWRQDGSGVFLTRSARYIAGAWSTPSVLSAPGVNDLFADLVADDQAVTAAWRKGANGSAAIVQTARFALPEPEPIPSLSEWALILFGLILAGGAAALIHRRRLAA